MEGKCSGCRHFLPSSRRESPECGGNGERHGTSCACVPPRSHPAYLRSIPMSQRTPPHGRRRSQHTSIHSSCCSWRRPSTSSAFTLPAVHGGAPPPPLHSGEAATPTTNVDDDAQDYAQQMFEELPKSMPATPIWIPQMGMKFSSVDEAWEFWVTYGGRMGFDVRKRYTNKSGLDGLVTTGRFVCSNQGSRAENKKYCVGKRNRAHTRTCCMVRMGITLDRENMTYKVHDLFVDHNHILHIAQTSHLMPSQRNISKHQAVDIEVADASGIAPKAAYEFLGRYLGGSAFLGFTHRDHKNYLRTKHQREMLYGEVGSLLKYFQDKVVENPSFQYAIQLDCNEQITNLFWADAKMIVDYAHFGDVITFESRNKQPRIWMMTPILIQANIIYTPTLFEVFQVEYEKSLATYIVSSNGTNEFIIAIGAFGGTFTPEEERKVAVNPTSQTVLCSCRLFERIGILCKHALKGLNLLNIKLLPEKYILKRWTRCARSEIVQDMHGRNIVENPNFDATLRYKNLCQLFLPLASRAADFEDCYLLVEEAVHRVSKQVEEKIRGTPNIDASNTTVQESFSLPAEFAHVTGLKKKEKQTGGSKRKKSWVEKFQKKKKNKANKKKTSNSKHCEESGSLVPNSQAVDTNIEASLEDQEYESLSRFNQLMLSSSITLDVCNPLGGLDGWQF